MGGVLYAQGLECRERWGHCDAGVMGAVGSEGTSQADEQVHNTSAQSGDARTKKRAENDSQAGGVKATCLAGVIFKNKDDKQGQQDTMIFFLKTSSAT